MNFNKLLQLQQLQGAFAAIQLSTQAAQAQVRAQAQAQARAQELARVKELARAQELSRAKAQVRMTLNNANVAASAATPMPMPKPTVNARLNSNYQSNQRIGHRDAVPVELKSTLPTAVSDDRPSIVIDLTKSPSKNINTQSTARFVGDAIATSTSNDTKWKHDLYVPNQKAANAMQHLGKQSETNTQSDVKNAAVDQKKNISSSWWTFGTNTNEPVKKPSVFDRLGPKVTENVQPSNDIHSRLVIEPPAPTIAKQTDTVDFVAQKLQQQPSLNPFHDSVTAVIEKTVI